VGRQNFQEENYAILSYLARVCGWRYAAPTFATNLFDYYSRSICVDREGGMELF